MRYLILFLISFTTFFLACRPSDSPQTSGADTSEAGLSDFFAFYQKFQQDSAFQMAHIMFPLAGLPAHADAATITDGTFRWYPEDWSLHRPVNYENSDYQREINPLSEEIIVEKIIHRSGQVGMLRRFAKIDDEWYLIYFADMNRLK